MKWNTKMLVQAAFKKLKSSVFFDKTQLVLRDKIVKYESEGNIEDKLSKLAQRIDSGETEFEDLICSINVLAFPKTVSDNDGCERRREIISNLPETVTEINSTQYFIDMDVEGQILGVLWVLLVGIHLDSKIYEHSYGNRLAQNLVDKNNYPSFSPYLFEPYFNQYEGWRDRALNCAKKSLNQNQDVVIITLDFMRFFYRVDVLPEEFDTLWNNNMRYIPKAFQILAHNLHSFVWRVLLFYSRILRKVDYEICEERTVLPIGFFPSNILSNIALSELDDAIINEWNPLYYGRYVDDIIIVEKIETNSLIYQKAKKSELTIDDIMNRYFKGIFRNFNEYRVNSRFNKFKNSKIVIQNKKVRIFYFDSEHSDALIDRFKLQINQNRSEFRFLPEETSAFDEGYINIYQLNSSDSPNKLCAINDISINKFNLSKYLGRYSIISRLVSDKTENWFYDQIDKIFSSNTIIENYLLWERVLSILCENERFDDYVNFVGKICAAIHYIRVTSEQPMIAEVIQLTLQHVLQSAVNRSLSLVWGPHVARVITRLAEMNNLDLKRSLFDPRNINTMRKNYCLTRMSNKYAMPLAIDIVLTAPGFFEDDKQINLTRMESIDVSICDFRKVFPQRNLYRYYPYLVSLNELSMFDILKNQYISDHKGMTLDELKRLYSKINYNNSGKKYEIYQEIAAQAFYVNHREIPAVKIGNGAIQKINIAVANTKLDLSNFNRNLEGRPNRSLERYKSLVKSVNEAISNKADILVLPENYLPFEWLPVISQKCAQTGMAVITGVEHLISKRDGTKYGANLTAVVLPFKADGRNLSYIHFHKKLHLAPGEETALISYGITPDKGKNYELYCWNNFWFSVYCCYELASINDRALFKSYVDALFAVEWNKDTNYYSNIVESLSRDIHCYCIQVNTSDYGDSRITKPAKTENKDLLKVKGGKNATVMVDEIDVETLRAYQLKGNLLQLQQTDSAQFKLTPPDYDCEITKLRQRGELWDYLIKQSKNK